MASDLSEFPKVTRKVAPEGVKPSVRRGRLLAHLAPPRPHAGGTRAGPSGPVLRDPAAEGCSGPGIKSNTEAPRRGSARPESPGAGAAPGGPAPRPAARPPGAAAWEGGRRKRWPEQGPQRAAPGSPAAHHGQLESPACCCPSPGDWSQHRGSTMPRPAQGPSVAGWPPDWPRAQQSQANAAGDILSLERTAGPRRVGPRRDRTGKRPQLLQPRPRAREALTAQEHFELLVVELGLPVGHQGALGTLPHGVHEAHAPQRHLLAAAPVAEALPAPAAVVLGAAGAWARAGGDRPLGPACRHTGRTPSQPGAASAPTPTLCREPRSCRRRTPPGSHGRAG